MKPFKKVQFSGEVLHLCFLKAVDHICCWGDYNFGCIISGVGALFESSRAAHNGLHWGITFLEHVLFFYCPRFFHLLPHIKAVIYSFVQKKCIVCCSLCAVRLPGVFVFLEGWRHLLDAAFRAFLHEANTNQERDQDKGCTWCLTCWTVTRQSVNVSRCPVSHRPALEGNRSSV